MNHYQFLINGSVYNEPVYTIQNIIGGVIDVVRIVITAWCLIALTILAIRYFVGTPTVKSEQNKVLPDYILGIVIFLGVANMLPFIVQFISSILEQL